MEVPTGWSARGVAVEIAVAAALLVVGVSVALFAGRHYTGRPSFYQFEFGPAVMIATGHGFVNPVPEKGSPLAEFLAQRRSSLPATAANAIQLVSPNPFQESIRYLMILVGCWWKLVGISWPAVWAVSAALYGVSVAACYAIFRQWTPRLFAVIGALFVGISSVHLDQMPHLRDYSKAPFILAVIPLIVVVALRPVSHRMLLLASGACGLVIGIGVGFRRDILMMAPIFLGSLVFFRADRPWRGLREKALAAATLVLAVLVSGGPVLLRLSDEWSSFHVVLLGYTDPYYTHLKIRPAAYTFGLEYSDLYVEEVLNGYSERRFGRPAVISTSAYDLAGRAYWLQIARHFPADLLTRTMAASNGILNLPFQNQNFELAALPLASVIAAGLRQLRALDGLGVLLASVLVVAGSVRRPRDGVFAAFVIFALSGYPSLQFERRHFFHLQVISILGLLVAAHGAWLWMKRGVRAATVRAAAPRAGLALAVLAIGLIVPVVSLRAYQTAHLAGLFSTYIGAPKTAVQPFYRNAGSDVWIVRWNGMEGSPSDRRSSGYYMLEFDWDGVPTVFAIGLRYHSPYPPDLSTVMALTAAPGVNRFFFPVYARPGLLAFDGIEMASSLKARLRGFYRIDDLDRLPLPLDLRLSSTWDREGLYERLKAERSPNPADIQFHGTPAQLSRIAWTGRLGEPALTPTRESVDLAYTKMASITNRGVEMDGPANARSADVFRFKRVALEKGAALLAQGRLESGGVLIGLGEPNGGWASQVAVTEPGSFVVIIEVIDPGTYAPLIGCSAARDGERARFLISQFGTVTAAH